MFDLDSALPTFDPMLQPIGYALASEFLGIDVPKGLPVVLPLEPRAGTPVEWFGHPDAMDEDEPDEPVVEIRKAG